MRFSVNFYELLQNKKDHRDFLAEINSLVR